MSSRIARVVVLVMVVLVPARVLSAVPDCHVGFYRLADGGGVDISPRDDGKLRWRMAMHASRAMRKKGVVIAWFPSDSAVNLRSSPLELDDNRATSARGRRRAVV
jgi:hypothetical protein